MKWKARFHEFCRRSLLLASSHSARGEHEEVAELMVKFHYTRRNCKESEQREVFDGVTDQADSLIIERDWKQGQW